MNGGGINHNSCRHEANIMQRIREGMPESEELVTPLRIYKERVVKFKETFIFRNHYVSEINSIVIFNVIVLCL